jgi:hypothetical protein
MRLNLIPQTVKQRGSSKAAWIVGPLVFLACAAGAVFMVIRSKGILEDVKAKASELQGPYDETVAYQKQIVDVVTGPRTVNTKRNIDLVTAMTKHVDEYPNLFNAIRPYIPAFFRINSIGAAPAGDTTTVTMTGTVGSFQQYADLMLALLRIPAPYGPVRSISRSGFQHTDAFVPQLTELDQRGRARKPGDAVMPDDPLERLQAMINQGAQTQTGYQSLNNFGADGNAARGAMANESLVTVRLVLPYKLQTPNPRDTLALFGGAGGGTAPAGGTPPTGPAPTTSPMGPGSRSGGANPGQGGDQ